MQAASILAGRDFATELAEEIENEADFIDRFGLAGDRILQYGGILQYDEALAIGVHVKVRFRSTTSELARGPELWLVGMEGVAGSSVSSDHDLAVRCAIKKLLAAAGPPGEQTEAGGNLPLAAGARERPDIHFGVSGLVRGVGKPAAIRRESSILFGEKAVQKGLWLPRLPARLLVALDRQRQDVRGRVGVMLRERQDLAIGTPGTGVLRVLGFGQTQGISSAIGLASSKGSTLRPFRGKNR